MAVGLGGRGVRYGHPIGGADASCRPRRERPEPGDLGRLRRERARTFPEFDWVTQFEQDTGCKVHTTDGVDSPNMVSLMATGQYDGVSASGDATLRMIAAGTVAPVNTRPHPQLRRVFAGLKNQPHNSVDGVPYGTPHGRGANVLLYNTDTFPTAPTSWDPLWDANSPAAGKISVYNSSIYIADAAMRLMNKNPELGITDPYQLNDEQFKAAVDLLKRAERASSASTGASRPTRSPSFWSGDMLAGQSWQYQYNVIKADTTGAPVGVTIPAEGATGWSDTWMIAKNAAHPGCMYRWMNWVPRPEDERDRPRSTSARHRSARRPVTSPRRGWTARTRATATPSTPPMRTTSPRVKFWRRRAATATTPTTRRPARTSRTGSRPGPRSRLRDARSLTIRRIRLPGRSASRGASLFQGDPVTADSRDLRARPAAGKLAAPTSAGALGAAAGRSDGLAGAGLPRIAGNPAPQRVLGADSFSGRVIPELVRSPPSSRSSRSRSIAPSRCAPS